MQWKLFANLAEAAGDRTVAVEREADTAAAALEALLEARPALREAVLADGDLADHVTVLRNGEAVADLSATVDADDELALLPPVSGG